MKDEFMLGSFRTFGLLRSREETCPSIWISPGHDRTNFLKAVRPNSHNGPLRGSRLLFIAWRREALEIDPNSRFSILAGAILVDSRAVPNLAASKRLAPSLKQVLEFFCC